MKQFKIHVQRAGLISIKQQTAFVSLASVVTDNGFCSFESWTEDCVHVPEKSAGIWHTTAVFTMNCDCDTRDTEQFLRGVAYSVCQLVPSTD